MQPSSRHSLQQVYCNFIAVDTWPKLGYERLRHFYWAAKNILRKHTKKTSPRWKQTAENYSSQWLSQVLGTKVQKVPKRCFHQPPASHINLIQPRLAGMNGPLNTSYAAVWDLSALLLSNLPFSITLFWGFGCSKTIVHLFLRIGVWGSSWIFISSCTECCASFSTTKKKNNQPVLFKDLILHVFRIHFLFLSAVPPSTPWFS